MHLLLSCRHTQQGDSSTHTHTQLQRFDPESECAAPHPVHVLVEHGVVHAAGKERRREVTQIHHLLRHAVLICLPEHHVLFFLLFLFLWITAVSLRAIAPRLRALSQHDVADKQVGTTRGCRPDTQGGYETMRWR